MQNFAAIDFETANNERTSVCSVGVVVVRDGMVTDTFYSLIQPEPNYYSYWCQQVHGLGHEDTDDAPVFPYVWAQIEPLIEGLPLVAHNKSFDESCLKAVFRCYQMDYPDYEFFCTCQAANVCSSNCLTTNCTPLPPIVAMTCVITTMPWPTPRPAPISPCNCYEATGFHPSLHNNYYFNPLDNCYSASIAKRNPSESCL